MRSPHSAIHAVTVARSGAGWLATCTCGDFERYCERRPSADRVARDHEKSHRPKDWRAA